MRDELFDRDFQAGRQHINGGIDRGLLLIGRAAVEGFRFLHARLWSAPWSGSRSCHTES